VSLRILVLSDWFPEDGYDVAGIFVRAQALAIAARHEVTVLHLRRPNGNDRRPRLEETVDGPLRVLRLGSGWLGSATATNLWTTGAVFRRLRREGQTPELLHAHEVGAGLAAVLTGRRLGLPVVVSEHSSGFATDDVTGLTARIARFVFAHADVVCPVSESLRATLVSGRWGGRHRVVPNAIDIELFTPPTSLPTGDPPLVLVVAALEPVKGVIEFVDAVGLLSSRRDDFRVVLVGDGPLGEAIARRVQELGVGDRLMLAGRVSHQELPEVMRAASFAVVPSRWETFSVVVGEAMACGLPVVATAVGALPERIDPSNGLLCPPGNPRALADAMGTMLDCHQSYDRQAIAEGARARYSPGAIAERWEEVYVEAISHRRGRIAGHKRPPAGGERVGVSTGGGTPHPG
jgi:glycosyltransferase involved in cell wall biosynthesis